MTNLDDLRHIMANLKGITDYFKKLIFKVFKKHHAVFSNLKQEGDDVLFEFEENFSNSSLIIKNRLTSKTLEYKIENNQVHVPLKDLFHFKKGIFDIFVKVGSKNTIRVRFTEKNESFYALYENEEKTLMAYSTKNQNLSLKFRKIIDIDYNINSFVLKDGKLGIIGLLDFNANINQDFSPDFFMRIVNRNNKKEYYEEIISGYIEIPMDNLLESLDFGIYDLYIICKLGNKEYKRRIKHSFKNSENKMYLNDSIYSVMFYSTSYGNLSFKFDYNYLITDLEIDGDNIIINGEFLNGIDIFSNEDMKDSTFSPNFFIEIKNRYSGQRIEREILSEETSFSLTEFLEIADGKFFDFYFKISNDSINTKKRIRFSSKIEKLKFTLKEAKKIFILYSTIHGGLSISLEEKDFDMDITHLENVNNVLLVKGNFSVLNEDITNISKVSIIGKYRFGLETNEFPLDFIGNEFEGFIDNFDFGDLDLLDTRIDFYFRIYDGEVFYQDLIYLSNFKSIVNDEDRFLVNIYKDDLFYSYYSSQGKHSFALWITTEQSFEKSYVIARGRTIYSDSLKEKLNENMIFFESFFGKSYAGNPKYIYETMLKMGLDKKYTFVWAYSGENKDVIPGNPIIVERFKAGDYYKYLALSKYWVNNIIFPIHYKRKGNVYLQTWHGTPLKKLGFDITIPGPEVEGRENFYNESRNWDYLISSNAYSTEIFKRAFKFKKDVLELGYPINDIFFVENGEKIKQLKEKLNLPMDKKIILYAPTWKDDEKNDSWEHYFKLEIDLERLREKFSDEYIILLKMHHLVSENLKIDEIMKDFAIDVSNYDDIQELYILSDILITDYSSVFFYYAHSKRPILFFVPDLEHYISNVRGLYLNMETDMPGPIIKDNDHLIECLENIDDVKEKFKEKYDEFYEEFCSICNGHSSEEIIKKVFEL